MRAFYQGLLKIQELLSIDGGLECSAVLLRYEGKVAQL